MKKKLCLVMTSPFFLEVFLIAQIQALSKLYQVSVVVNTPDRALLTKLGLDAKLIQLRIERKIRPLHDIRALLALIQIFRVANFDLVHSATPKAGLLAMAAAYITGISVRIHTFTGQVWGTKIGVARFTLKLADRGTAFFASDILVDSSSQRDFIIQEGIVPLKKASVLANGSINGVNINRFRPAMEFREKIRVLYTIPMDAYVIIYMARLTRDKGAIMIAKIFAKYGFQNPGAHILIVGPDEESLLPKIKELCNHCIDRVHFVGQVNCPEEYMAAADIFCLPSFREGFGTVFINAAAVGIPSIASRIYGSSDAVVDGETGCLFEPGNVDECVKLLEHFARNQALRYSMGFSARKRVVEKFSEELLTQALLDFYKKRLSGYTAYTSD